MQGIVANPSDDRSSLYIAIRRRTKGKSVVEGEVRLVEKFCAKGGSKKLGVHGLPAVAEEKHGKSSHFRHLEDLDIGCYLCQSEVGPSSWAGSPSSPLEPWLHLHRQLQLFDNVGMS